MSPLIEPVDLAALLSRRPPSVVPDVRRRLGGPACPARDAAAHIRSVATGPVRRPVCEGSR